MPRAKKIESNDYYIIPILKSFNNKNIKDKCLIIYIGNNTHSFQKGRIYGYMGEYNEVKEDLYSIMIDDDFSRRGTRQFSTNFKVLTFVAMPKNSNLLYPLYSAYLPHEENQYWEQVDSFNNTILNRKDVMYIYPGDYIFLFKFFNFKDLSIIRFYEVDRCLLKEVVKIHPIVLSELVYHSVYEHLVSLPLNIFHREEFYTKYKVPDSILVDYYIQYGEKDLLLFNEEGEYLGHICNGRFTLSIPPPFGDKYLTMNMTNQEDIKFDYQKVVDDNLLRHIEGIMHPDKIRLEIINFFTKYPTSVHNNDKFYHSPE